jgi:acyl-[acyl-carrier-protein]-phospholipid O-acyltransferase/long-chain-fatty-acid--[acyl-carrier-protein] ligase
MRMLIAPNHLSLIMLHAILPVDASFAVVTGIAGAWWAKPFLRMIRHYTIDPTKPLATRDLIKHRGRRTRSDLSGRTAHRLRLADEGL